MQEASGEGIDSFDQVQLAYVTETHRKCRNPSEASRTLLSAPRELLKPTNDAGRLRKYLAKFGFRWSGVAG